MNPKPRVAVVLFPGSNCDHDALHGAETVLGADARLVRYDSRDLGDPDLVILPGGFSYGDYLRCGAMARFAPVMESVGNFAGKGGAVLGICNGFQILCEAGLLPGALLRNAGLRFVCKDVFVRVETKRTPFTLTLN
ncbi:MAG TPA: phosphoribosylformylglycinamidine synthase subunit PurQ, partial [Thermoanaerobaculia bacterium]|nr:phosphoribosylformylglycinamidine synthase subunit PurQ [Thermoanaerobaculia bacterium]